MKDINQLQDICSTVTELIHGPIKYPEYGYKLMEEACELNNELSGENYSKEHTMDEVGDVMMCLARIASDGGFSLYNCLHGALVKNVERLKDKQFKR